jgi:hypothetical protein
VGRKSFNTGDRLSSFSIKSDKKDIHDIPLSKAWIKKGPIIHAMGQVPVSDTIRAYLANADFLVMSAWVHYYHDPLVYSSLFSFLAN